MQRQGQSETDLVAAVRRAASEASSASYGASRRRHHHHHSSESDLHSRASSRYSGGSKSSSRFAVTGFTLEEQQKAVQESAMNRYMAQLEKEAREAVRERANWDRAITGAFDEERNELVRRQEMCKQNQEKVRQQMELNKVRRADDRRTFIEAASSHSFPLFTETFIDEVELEAYRKRQKEQWREELDRQMVTNMTLRNVQLKRYKDQAIQRHHDNVQTVQRERGLERERLVSQGREMMSSWERDIKLKSLKKAILKGEDVVQEVEQVVATGGRPRQRGSP